MYRSSPISQQTLTIRILLSKLEDCDSSEG